MIKRDGPHRWCRSLARIRPSVGRRPGAAAPDSAGGDSGRNPFTAFAFPLFGGLTAVSTAC